MKFTMTRDSVAAGDDAYAPHEIILETEKSLMEIFSMLTQKYLPVVDGNMHAWKCYRDKNLVATILHDGQITLHKRLMLQNNDTMHFVYHSRYFG